eukprot:365292_1
MSSTKDAFITELIQQGFTIEEATNAYNMSITSDGTNVIDEMKSNNVTEVNDECKKILCICGAELIEMTLNMQNIVCDNCYKALQQNESFYHCAKDASTHPYGYDVCRKCSLNTTTNTSFERLINMGFEHEKVLIALQVTTGNFDNALIYLRGDLDLEEATILLRNMGYSANECMDAFIEAKYDVNVAIYYLQNGLPKPGEARVRSVKVELVNNDENKQEQKALDEHKQKQKAVSENKQTQVTQHISTNTLTLVDIIDEVINFLEFADYKSSTTPSTQHHANQDCLGLLECSAFSRIISVLKKYKANANLDFDPHITSILNDYHHLILMHYSDDEFESICTTLGNCNVLKCNIMQRTHHQEQKIDNHNDDDEKFCAQTGQSTPAASEILDEIHCHFMHCYDIGYRLLSEERQKVESNDAYIDEPFSVHKYEKQIKALQQILSAKQKLYQQVIKSESMKKFNQLKQPNDKNIYSFGQGFYYWTAFKYRTNTDDRTPGYRYCDWYVEKKYNTLKDELTNNKVSSISVMQWMTQHGKAVQYHRTNYCKRIISQPEIFSIPSMNTTLYDIPQGIQIGMEHLMSIIVYCGYTMVAFKFSETFRRLPSKIMDCDTKILQQMIQKQLNPIGDFQQQHPGKETDQELKDRHRNFYHLAKFITEAILVYSKPSFYGNVSTFYHGIDQEFMFNSTQCAMYQPFSTSSSQAVAITFSRNTGMILEMNCHPKTRYFDCWWLSKYSNEQEMLFICFQFQIFVVNIFNTSNYEDYKLYINAIRLIESVVGGDSFDEDENVLHNMIKKNKQVGKLPSVDPTDYGGKKITKFTKLLAIKLIKHELSRYDSEKYKRYNAINPYIEELLHNICIKKEFAFINWKLMNCELHHYIDHGYQGYLFLKLLLCEQNCEMIKFDIVTDLYPNIESVWVDELSGISLESVSCIYQYLSNNKTKIRHIAMRLSHFDDLEQLIPSIDIALVYYQQ